jgi:hypothetical protein
MFLNLKYSTPNIISSSIGGMTLYERSDPREVWCWSSTATASRALAIIAVLRAMSLFEGVLGFFSQ